jgi:hypothetical protein
MQELLEQVLRQQGKEQSKNKSEEENPEELLKPSRDSRHGTVYVAYRPSSSQCPNPSQNLPPI